jgi:hypothetical protein
MAKDSSKLLYAGDGEIYLAPVGTTLPVDVATALPAAWKGLGFMAEEGVTISGDVDTTDVMAWQIPDPIDVRVTSRNIQIQGDFLQYDQQNFDLAFGGGGTWSGTTLVTYVSASGSTPKYWACVVETIEATKKFRYCFPKVGVSESSGIPLRRNEAARSSVAFRALNTGSGNTMTVLSDVVSVLT